MKMNDIKYENPAIEKDSLTTYKSADLYLSAFLKTQGAILQNTTKENGKVFFAFQDDGGIQSLVNQYFNDAPVPVLQFKASLGTLRSIIFGHHSLQKAGQPMKEKYK